jgi:nicotinamidase-related amidase
MTGITLEPATTALVLIDLQRGIVARPTAPHAAGEVVRRGAALAAAARARGVLVVLVRVAFDPALRLRLAPPVDAPIPAGPVAPDFGDLVPELAAAPDDVIVTKRQWGAFYGTELEMQLRRRGIGTLVLGGISTNYGVESTARVAWELGFHLVFVEDAMASFDPAAHAFPLAHVFPRIGRVRSSAEVLGALGA